MRVRVQRGVLSFALLAASGSVLGLVFAGSPERIAAGVQIAGINVGGMKPRDAQRLLERHARALDRAAVVFVAGDRRWRVTPEQLAVHADWGAAVELAQRHGDGFGPFRGFRRIGVRVFGAEVSPPARVYEHKPSGAFITTPPLPLSDSVLPHHLLIARTTVDRARRRVIGSR